MKAQLLLLALFFAARPASAQLTERLYTDACDEGDTSACIVFGLMSELGEGVEQDFVRARSLYRRACETGDLVGCTNLGLMYEEGRGGEQDMDEARGRYRIACEGDELLACQLLAAMDQPAGDETRYLKRGRVADAETTTALSNALVEVPELDIHQVSDRQGNVTLGRLPEGTYEITAKRLGYLDLDGELQVPGGTQFMIMLNRMPEPDTAVYGRVVGRVTDGGTRTIPDVDVSIVGQDGVRALSNAEGRFAFANVEPGLVQVRFTRLGYAPRTATLVVQAGRTSDLTAAMSPEAIELAPIEVTVRSLALERSGYYDRVNRGLGRHFDGEELQRLMFSQPSDALQRIPGVRLSDPRNIPGTPQYAVSPRVNTAANGQCIMDLYIDGILQGDPDLNILPPEWIAAMEIYTGSETPPQYSGLNPCGVVLMWTTR